MSRMPHLVLLSCLLVLATAVSAPCQEPTPFEDPAGGKWGYRDPATHRVLIPPRFICAEKFNAHGRALAATKEGWALIDRQGNALLRPFIFDNWPDEFSDGLARFIQDGKIGYFNPKGEVVVPARYDFGEPFSNGLAAVCLGCITVKDGEHSRSVGGQWGCIDRSGRIVRPVTSPVPECFR